MHKVGSINFIWFGISLFHCLKNSTLFPDSKYFSKEIKGSAESDGHIIVVWEKKETIKGNKADANWIKFHIRRFDKDCKIGR